MSKSQKGATFLEILISLTIASIMLIMLFQVIDYTVIARNQVESIKKGVEYSESFTKLFINKLKEKEILPGENIIDYLSETPDQRQMLEKAYELEDYQYSFIMLEDEGLKEGLQKNELMKGLKFSTGEDFNFEIFQDLIESGALMLTWPKQKEIQAKAYEGLILDVTEKGELAIRQNVVVASEREFIEMEVTPGAGGWIININPRSLKLDETKQVHIVMNTTYFHADHEINIEINNNTACPIIIELRGTRLLDDQVRIRNRREDVPLLVYESQLDYPTQGYVLIAIVTTKNRLGENKVVKQSLFYL